MPNRRYSPLSRTPIVGALCALAVLAVVVAGCGDDDSATPAGVSVSTSTTQLADIATEVGGERAEVTGILAPNADPHDYEPRPSDAESVTDADLILQSGGDLDLWVDELIESSGSEAPVTTILDSVHTIEGGHGHEEEEGHSEEEEHAAGEEEEHAEEELSAEEEETDPHWWQDPANAIIAAEVIRDQLIEIDPDGRESYERNTDEYVKKIEALDEQISDCMESISPEERRLVTSHDALGYFADRYDIEVIGAVIPALTTQAQPSAGETQELVDLIEEQNVNAVFPEAGVSADLEQTIAEEAGAEIGDELWADTLGPEGSSGATYLEATAHNANVLADGFTGGETPCAVSA